MIKAIFKQSVEIFYSLVKVILPIMVILEVLKYFGFIEILGHLLGPIMLPLGLPGEWGIFWATAITLNLYNGLAVFFTLAPELNNLTLNQVTVLMTIALVAHSLPVEQKILQLAGIKIIPSTLFRLSFAYLLGWGLNKIYLHFSYFNVPVKVDKVFSFPPSLTLADWFINAFWFFLTMFLIIVILVSLIKVLEKFKIDQMISCFLAKLLKPIGVSEIIMPSMIIGILLGLSYGGGLLVKEVKEKKIIPMDVIKVMFFLSLSHSLIEDTLLVMTTGAHYSGVLIARVIFTFIVMMGLHFLTSNSIFFKKKLIDLAYSKKINLKVNPKN